MVTIIDRMNRKGQVVLYAYAKNSSVSRIEGGQVKSNSLNTKISLGIAVSPDEWDSLREDLKVIDDAKKKGRKIFVGDNDDVLKLWNVKNKLKEMEDTGVFDVDKAACIIRDTLHGEETSTVDIVAPKRDEKNLGKTSKQSLMSFLDKYIADCESGKRLHQKKKTRLSNNTLNAFRNLRSALMDYEECRKQRIDFNDVTQLFFDDFVYFLFNERKYKDGKERIARQNTCFTYITALKTIMKISKHEGFHNNNSYELGTFSIERGNADNIYLTEEQVSALYLADFTDPDTLKSMVDKIEDKDEREELHKRLFETRQKKRHRQYYQDYKDLFVIGCLTGQRHSDYERINIDMIKESDGFKFIDIIQKKTGKRVLIPLDSRVEEILKRHGGSIKKYWINTMCRGMKDIGVLMGWTYNAGIKEYVGSEKLPTGKRFCDLITTHTARRTWATNAYKKHVPLSSIMAVTGHGSEMMLRKYLKLNEEEKGLSAARDLLKSGFMNLAQ